jgi:hypothetical protein
MDKLDAMWRVILGKNKKKQNKVEDIWKEYINEIETDSLDEELENPTYYLTGDKVRIPGGRTAKVTRHKDDKVDVFIESETKLDTFNVNEINLIEAIDGWTAGVTTGSQHFKSKYKHSKHDFTSHMFKQQCQHAMDEFTLLEDFKIYLSGRRGNKVKEQPTIGCYMDSGWVNSMFMVTPNCPTNDNLLTSPSNPYMYIQWPDMKGIPLMEYSQAVVWCISRLFEGHKLEIGCFGGHGRTGTLLAGILVYQGMNADEAISKVRKDHCVNAIETKVQEELIQKYCEELRKESNDGNSEDTTSGHTATNNK